MSIYAYLLPSQTPVSVQFGICEVFALALVITGISGDLFFLVQVVTFYLFSLFSSCLVEKFEGDFAETRAYKSGLGP